MSGSFTPEYEFMIGPYASGSAAMVNVETSGSVGVVYNAPKWDYKNYSKERPLGDGSIRATGWATAVWDWDVISGGQRDFLRTFIPGGSAEVWIKTKGIDNMEAWVVKRGIAIWPSLTEDHAAGRRIKFEIKFQRLTDS